MKEKIKFFLSEFFIFGLKQARSCVFAGSFFILLFLSSHIPLFSLARYDFIFLGAILIQLILILTKIESIDEAKTILLFHILGFTLEAFKTNPAIGSWAYPEPGFFKIFNVPLYSGFMYAAVSSYMSQSWRIHKMRLINYPSYWITIPTAVLVYLNFFTHHFIGDYRWYLTALIIIVFIKTQAKFTVTKKEYSMPLLLSFFLIAFFVWIAENISTFLGAWQYPNQEHTWHIVSFSKISSWSLLVIISFIIVANLKHIKEDLKKHQN